MEAIKKLNREIARHREILSPLIPISETVLGDGKTGVKIYTAWAGDKGLLVVLRNMDYTTDDEPDDGGRAPRFKANPKNDLKVQIAIPEWLNFRKVREFATGRTVPAVQGRKGLEVKIKRLGAYQVLWIENEKGGRWEWMKFWKCKFR